MSNGYSTDPADWRRVWQKALKARVQGYSTAEINDATQEALGVDFPTLTRQLMAIENVQDPEVKASPLAPLDASQAAQGRVGPGWAALLTPALGITGGMAERLSPTLAEYGRMANESAPLNAAMGRFTGGGLLGAATGEIPVPIGEGMLAPLASTVRGAVRGAPLGLLGEYAQQPDLLHPNVGQLAKGAALTGALGGMLGLVGEAGSRIYNPAVQQTKIGVETSVPGTEFGFPQGMKALENLPVEDPVLQPLMAQRGNLGVVATKYLRKSQIAANEAQGYIQDALNRVGAKKAAIANDPVGGYDAILEGKTLNDPAAIDVLRQHGTTEPTARNAFELYKDLKGNVVQAQKMQARATGRVRMGEMHNDAADAAVLNQALRQEVPEFGPLQERYQQYLQQERALRELRVQVQGRGVYLKGQTPPPPPKTKLDQLREALKLTNYFGAERAARTMVPMLFGTNSPADMLAGLKAAESVQQLGALLPQFGTGGTAGLLGMPRVRDRLGLLAP